MDIEYPWNVLDIEPTTEKKIIREAYAKKLKQHKPDEDPESFQFLFKAYKSALETTFDKGSSANKVLVENPNSQAKVSKTLRSKEDNPNFESGVEPDQPLEFPKENEKNFSLLTEQINMIVKDSDRVFDWPSWRILFESTSLLDTSFHDRISLFVFCRLNELRNPPSKQEERNYIVSELDTLFGWSLNREFFKEKLGVVACEYVLGEEPRNPSPQESPKLCQFIEVLNLRCPGKAKENIPLPNTITLEDLQFAFDMPADEEMFGFFEIKQKQADFFHSHGIELDFEKFRYALNVSEEDFDAKRRTDNAKVLRALNYFMDEYPSMRFSQVLANFGFVTAFRNESGNGVARSDFWKMEYFLEPGKILNRLGDMSLAEWKGYQD